MNTDRDIKIRLGIAAGFTGITFLVELIGGFIFNSLALLSDAFHVLMDVLALVISLFAIYISGLPPTETRTYGLHRMEVFASFINGTSLILISLFISYKAYQRFVVPIQVESTGMLVVAIIGMIVNLLVALWLRDYARADLNVRSALLHVLGDALFSVGVIGGAVVIHYTGWNHIDPLISVVISCVIFISAVKIVKESSHILLEGVPKDVDLNSVVEDIRAVEGVEGVHSIHIWSICHNTYALSAHVTIKDSHRHRTGEILHTINKRLADTYHIFYTTLQPECPTCNSNDIFRTIEHRGYGHTH